MIKRPKFLEATMINLLTKNGSKWKSEKILFKTLKSIQKKNSKDAFGILKLAIINSSPYFQIKKIRRKKKNPVEFPFLLQNSTRVIYGIKSIILKSKYKKFNTELLESSNQVGLSFASKKTLHKEAFLKKKVANYRWFF
jgi:ribosomal protein S7|tara:strand:+ start:188 stop:604 length:417 start_codon:yes stop_codon:yes gene_type:complete